MRVIHDYAATGLSLKAHPMAFVRETLHRAGITPAGDLLDPKRHPHGKRAGVCGLVLVRQRPATASGVLFVTLEDETGVANLVIRPHIYEKFRRAIRLSTALVAWGKIERDAGGQVTHLLVTRAQNLTDLTHAAPAVTPGSRDFH